jgi:hypothetical protein
MRVKVRSFRGHSAGSPPRHSILGLHSRIGEDLKPVCRSPPDIAVYYPHACPLRSLCGNRAKGPRSAAASEALVFLEGKRQLPAAERQRRAAKHHARQCVIERIVTACRRRLQVVKHLGRQQNLLSGGKLHGQAQAVAHFSPLPSSKFNPLLFWGQKSPVHHVLNA